jgi:hypothetical protein
MRVVSRQVCILPCSTRVLQFDAELAGQTKFLLPMLEHQQRNHGLVDPVTVSEFGYVSRFVALQGWSFVIGLDDSTR